MGTGWVTTLSTGETAAVRVPHLADRPQWETDRTGGLYRGSTRGADLAAVGYVHTCTRAQLPGVVRRFYGGVPAADLVLLVLDTAVCEAAGSALRWDPVPGGELFPHVVGPVPLAAVVAVLPAPAGPDGAVVAPADDDPVLAVLDVRVEPGRAQG